MEENAMKRAAHRKAALQSRHARVILDAVIVARHAVPPRMESS
jgi:hypothetical protein